jgi:hypothetical protein
MVQKNVSSRITPTIITIFTLFILVNFYIANIIGPTHCGHTTFYTMYAFTYTICILCLVQYVFHKLIIYFLY